MNKGISDLGIFSLIADAEIIESVGEVSALALEICISES